MKDKLKISGEYFVLLLRIFVGGHILFNGLIKIINPNWSSKSYLEGSYGIFKWLGVQDTLLGIIDPLNMWLLIIVGVALIIGSFERIAAIIGTILLGFYYFAYPPFDIFSKITGGSGAAFIVNPLLIEIIALLVIFFVPTGKMIGIDRLFERWFSKIRNRKQPEKIESSSIDRREVIKSLATVPLVGLFSIPFFQSQTYESIDANTGATSLAKEDGFGAEYKRLKELNLDDNDRVKANREEMPHGKIGNLNVSRLVAGNSYISGNYNARDLRYVADLAKLYNTEDRLFMTLKSMEKSGINTIFLNFRNFLDFQLLNYWKEWGGKIQWISELLSSDIDKFEHLIERNLKIGAAGICISRETCDKWVANKEYDNLPKAIEIIKKFNVPAGIGAYYNETIAFAVKEKLKPDFYFKSFHKDNYWSAHPKIDRDYMEVYKETSRLHNRFHDNLWCQNPDEFAELMKEVDVPFIAFKVTAAGAIPFQEGFEFALRNKADFVCTSLFDFQVGDCVRSLNRAYLNM